MTAEKRIKAIENFVELLLLKRNDIIEVLIWEICKSSKDATAEFDRTIAYIKATICVITQLNSTGWNNVSGITAKVRRAAVGVMLAVGPFNYPLNETYASLIPALLAGNTVILKLPTVGGMAHVLAMEAFAATLPPGTYMHTSTSIYTYLIEHACNYIHIPGVINFVSGSGKKTLPSIMRSGDIDLFAFIGGSNTANSLIKEHPAPHRLKTILQLEVSEYINIYMKIYTHIKRNVFIYIYVCIYVHMYICMYKYIFLHMYIFINTYLCTYTYI
jgi:glyceraldehyde-3-phosphate dehydrogenase (NADP+)